MADIGRAYHFKRSAQSATHANCGQHVIMDPHHISGAYYRPANLFAMEELEETARLVFALGADHAVLSESQIQELTKDFGVKW